jgi:hypothetical protein
VIAGRPGEPLGVRVIERQGIEREVVRLERQRRIERRHPRREIGIGDVVQEIDVDRRDPRGPGVSDGIGDMPRAMPPAELAQLGVIERLRPERQPADPEVAPRDRVAPLVRSRVGLERDLGIRCEAEARPHPREKVLDLAGGQERGRPAAEVHRVEYRPIRSPGQTEGPVEHVRSQLDLAQKRIKERADPVARPPRRRPGDDHEVAVRAERDAERDVDVERDRGTRGGGRLAHRSRWG